VLFRSHVATEFETKRKTVANDPFFERNFKNSYKIKKTNYNFSW
jgi:hypothetical protein